MQLVDTLSTARRRGFKQGVECSEHVSRGGHVTDEGLSAPRKTGDKKEGMKLQMESVTPAGNRCTLSG